MAKRIGISVDEDLHSVLWQLSELRGESMAKIVGDLADTKRKEWALEIARWKVARRKEEEVARQIEKLRRATAGEKQGELEV